MSKPIKILSILFSAQLLIVAVIWLGGLSGGKTPSSSPLLEINTDLIDEISIREGEKVIQVAKNNGRWSLPNYGGLAVVESRLTTLLDALNNLKTSWPIATTSSAATRFEVAEANAQKVISLRVGGELQTTLYLGTSPSFKKLHLRKADDKEIYSVNFSQSDAPVEEKDWFDNTIFQLDGDITSAKTEKFELTKNGEDWTVVPTEENKSADKEAINAWTNRFGSLRLKEWVNANEAEKILIQDPAFTVEVSSESTNIGYAFYRDADKIYIKKAGENHLFLVSDIVANPIVDVELSSLLKEKEEPSNISTPEETKVEVDPQL